MEKGSLTTHAVLYIQLFHIELLLGMQLFLALHVGIEHAHISFESLILWLKADKSIGTLIEVLVSHCWTK